TFQIPANDTPQVKKSRNLADAPTHPDPPPTRYPDVKRGASSRTPTDSSVSSALLLRLVVVESRPVIQYPTCPCGLTQCVLGPQLHSVIFTPSSSPSSQHPPNSAPSAAMAPCHQHV